MPCNATMTCNKGMHVWMYISLLWTGVHDACLHTLHDMHRNNDMHATMTRNKGMHVTLACNKKARTS